MSFSERLARGKEAENAFCLLLKENNIEYITTEEKLLRDYNIANYTKFATYFDATNGDVWLKDEQIRIDVKRGFVTKNSVNKFEGEYFALYNSNLSKLAMMSSMSMNIFFRVANDKNWLTPAPSGDLGYPLVDETYPYFFKNGFSFESFLELHL